MHFYTHTGQPAHFQPNKSKPGQTRPTTVRDAKAQNLVPSVTTLQNMIAKPALVKWLQEQPLKYLAENMSLHVRAESDCSVSVDTYTDDSPTTFAREVIKASTEQTASSTANRGTELHKMVEDYFSPRNATEEGEQYAEAIVSHLYTEFGILVDDYHISCEEYFAATIGFGGCIDLILAHKLTGEVILVDYKSKEWDTDAAKLKRLHYEENCEQLAAYRIGYGAGEARCINIYMHREQVEIRSHEWTPEDLEYGLKAFLGAFNIWCARKRWSPSF